MLKLTSNIFLLFIVIFFGACSTTEKINKQQTVEEIYKEAVMKFENGDWNEAAAQFDIIKLQYPASQYADDAQYMMAEINFKRSEFIVAAFNYSMVRRSYPASELAKPAMFKSALCYNELSGPPDRDQEYTRKAIQAFSEFQSVYPVDSLALVCVDHIHTLRSKLSERYMMVAEHYVTTRSYKAAVVYYESVIDEYPDTEWYESALIEKIRVLILMHRLDEAKATLVVLQRTVKAPKLQDKANELEKLLP